MSNQSMKNRYLFRGFHPCDTGTEKVFVNDEWIKGKWVYGSYLYIRYKEKHYICDGSVWFGTLNPYKDDVLPETVGQYTGLTDNTDKETKIFDGDILSFFDGKEKGYVVYDKKYCKFKIKVFGHGDDWQYTTFDFEYGYKVIGNIYSNPNILEMQK